MYIKVKNDGELVFKGVAEQFLEINDYDEEMIEILNELDQNEIGTKTNIYGNFGDVFEVEKVEDEELIY